MKRMTHLNNSFYSMAFSVFSCFSFLITSLGYGGEEDSDNFRQKMVEFSRNEGYKIAASLKNNSEWIDLSSVIAGIQDYMGGKEASTGFEHTWKEYRSILEYLFEKAAETNLLKANALLKTFETNPSMHALENSKVWYQVIQEGKSSETVGNGSSPLLHYSIVTLGGEEVVSTNIIHRPHRVCLKETLPGFAAGIEGMHVGEKRKIFIHPDMAYGINGSLPPNSLLIAEVEVVGV